MPRYFFDTDDGDQSHRDDEGHDLPDVQAARVAALDVLPDMARDKMPDGDRRTFVASVRDDQGAIIYIATLSLKGEWRSTR